MEWILINKDNLPCGQVLAACFRKKPNSFVVKLFGTLLYNYENNTIECEGYRNVILKDCTHYIDICEFDIKLID